MVMRYSSKLGKRFTTALTLTKLIINKINTNQREMEATCYSKRFFLESSTMLITCIFYLFESKLIVFDYD